MEILRKSSRHAVVKERGTRAPQGVVRSSFFGSYRSRVDWMTH
jgi:hypothetical protein